MLEDQSKSVFSLSLPIEVRNSAHLRYLARFQISPEMMLKSLIVSFLCVGFLVRHLSLQKFCPVLKDPDAPARIDARLFWLIVSFSVLQHLLLSEIADTQEVCWYPYLGLNEGFFFWQLTSVIARGIEEKHSRAAILKNPLYFVAEKPRRSSQILSFVETLTSKLFERLLYLFLHWKVALLAQTAYFASFKMCTEHLVVSQFLS